MKRRTKQFLADGAILCLVSISVISTYRFSGIPSYGLVGHFIIAGAAIAIYVALHEVKSSFFWVNPNEEIRTETYDLILAIRKQSPHQKVLDIIQMIEEYVQKLERQGADGIDYRKVLSWLDYLHDFVSLNPEVDEVTGKKLDRLYLAIRDKNLLAQRFTSRIAGVAIDMIIDDMEGR